jgi:hypothetical protein
MFYPTSQIIVCESPSQYKSELKIECTDYIHIQNPIPNSMTLGCIKHYLENYNTSSGKKIITLHDSMILKSRFNPERLNQKFGFVWYFNNSERTNLGEDIVDDTPEFLYYFNALSTENRDFAGCFGMCIFGDYEHVEALWNQLGYDTKVKNRRITKNFVLNQERMFGICAFYLKLVDNVQTCSLCNSIFDCPYIFNQWFNTTHTFEQIQNINYKEACIKLSKYRTAGIPN